MPLVPSEIAIAGVYLPPLLFAGILGTVAAILTAFLLNRYRVSRFFYYPPAVFLALAVIYTSFIAPFSFRHERHEISTEHISENLVDRRRGRGRHRRWPTNR